MYKWIIYFLLILTAICGCSCDWIRGGDRTPPPVKVYNDQQQRTPMGNIVASKNGVTQSFIAATDAAIFKVVEDAKTIYGNQPFLTPTNYLIYAIPDCTLSPVYRTRSFTVNGILAAEYVASHETRAYVVCEVDTPDTDLRNALRYGPEHIILFNVDYDKWNVTKDACCHIHPLLPETQP